MERAGTGHVKVVFVQSPTVPFLAFTVIPLVSPMPMRPMQTPNLSHPVQSPNP